MTTKESRGVPPGGLPADPGTGMLHAHVAEVVDRLRRWCDARGLPAVVLTSPNAVSWATGGANVAIDRELPTDATWVVVGPALQTIVTNNVEAPRVQGDGQLERLGFEVVTVPWYEADAHTSAVRHLVGRQLDDIPGDGHPALRDELEEIIELRLSLTDLGVAELRRLGADTSRAVEQALLSWHPGDTDSSVQGRMVGELERVGAEASVALVAGDERIDAFRHPVALGVPMHERVMAVVVSRRRGLHVALTRFVHVQPLEDELAARFRATRQVEEAVLNAAVRGARYGAVTEVLEQSYREVGHEGAWREHWQGGPIGYGTREFELAPGDTARRWWHTTVQVGHSLAWNPSLSGGAKVEDTFVVTAQGLECVTPTFEWPTELTESRGERRAAVLVREEP